LYNTLQGCVTHQVPIDEASSHTQIRRRFAKHHLPSTTTTTPKSCPVSFIPLAFCIRSIMNPHPVSTFSSIALLHSETKLLLEAYFRAKTSQIFFPSYSNIIHSIPLYSRII